MSVRFATLCLPLMLAGMAQAQSVWRCGSDGSAYTDVPCPQGRAVELAQARPEADLLGAQDVARRESALAARLRHERQLREAQVPAGAAGIRGVRPAEPAGLKPKSLQRPQGKRRLADDGTWRAIAPASRRAPG